MRKLTAFFRLKPQARTLFLQTWLLGLVVRLALWVLPFRIVKRWLFPSSHSSAKAQPTQKSQLIDLDEAVRVMETGFYYVPAATCLVKAIAAQILLRRYGYPSQMHIGVAKSPEGKLLAHAWVEQGGTIVFGGSEASNYTLLSSWKS